MSDDGRLIENDEIADNLLDDARQEQLFEAEPDWKDTLWRGMPEYKHENLEPWQTMLVHFRTPADKRAFSDLVGQVFQPRTKFIWYPKAEIRKASDKVWSGEKVNPRHPVYVISKGRWESRLTAKALEWTGIPYHIVVEPQERDQYAAVINPAKILVTPFSNLGQGGIPARNFVWDHAVASGAERHWILDDNIAGFCRFQDNLKVEVDSGVTFRAVEDWVDRYENVVMAAFNYDYFAPRKQGGIRPITLNTRCYSGILLRNDLMNADGTPMRWRGRYNEDTDLSLRILKQGHCTALFNAFLMYKKPTLTMKGGNTDELYKGAEAAAAEWEEHADACKQCGECKEGYPTEKNKRAMPCAAGRAILEKDGRWLMAESLREQHPDCTSVERKWRRWQHQVDYRAFRHNKLVLRPDAVIPDGTNDYGMTLGAMPTDALPSPAATRLTAFVESSGPSVLDFLRSLQEDESPAEPAPVIVELAPAQPATEAGQLGVAETLGQEERPALSQPEASLEAPGPELEPEPEPEPVIDEPAPDLGSASTPSFFEAEAPAGQSLAEFLGTASPPTSDWRPGPLPDLDGHGIRDIVLNFETNGLRWWAGDEPVGVTIGTLDGKMSCYLPFGHRGSNNLNRDVVIHYLKHEIRHKRITNVNTRFDIHMGRVLGVDFEAQGCEVSDVMHWAALLDDHRKRFALDVLAQDYLGGVTVDRIDERNMADYDASSVARRAEYQATLVAQLHAKLWPLLDAEDLQRVRQLEDEVIYPVCEMERNGSPLDLELLEQYHAECTRRHGDLMLEVSKEVGFAFEHTASGWRRLLEHYQLKVPDSFAEDVLNEYDHPMVRKAQMASRYASLNSKTFAAYKKQIGADGILRYDINQLRGDEGGTVSGRFSIGYVQQVPNLDNHSAVFGDDLFPRRLFIAGEGEYLESDAMQIEYRILAHLAQNPAVLKAYKDDPTQSFHKMTHAMMQRYKPDMLYSHQKSFNFARQYGAKSIKLAIMMGFITNREGDEIRAAKRWNDPRLNLIHEIENAYRRMMPEGDMLLERAAHLAKSACDSYCKRNDALHRQHKHRGYVKTLLGRRSRFPNNWKTYIGLNRVIQGTAADVMKRKLVELHKERKHTGFVMRLTVHDAVGGDATTPETKDRVAEILNRQSFPELKVPILWTAGTGRSWADCK